MGIFDALRNANEEAHGARLRRGFEDTLIQLSVMDGDSRARTIAQFIDKREKLLGRKNDMTEKGMIDMGRYLQKEARRKYDLQKSEAIALWMAGGWLEGSVRASSEARGVSLALEELAEKMM